MCHVATKHWPASGAGHLSRMTICLAYPNMRLVFVGVSEHDMLISNLNQLNNRIHQLIIIIIIISPN